MLEKQMHQQVIGMVTGGGLKENLHIRLSVPPHLVQEGSFIVVECQDWLYYGIATDLQLCSIDPRYALQPSQNLLPSDLAGLLDEQMLYTNLVVLPVLMLERGPLLDSPQYAAWRLAIDHGEREEPRPMPIKSIPAHHALARLAGAGDVAEIFGKPEKKENFVIGFTREQDHPVCLDLDRLIQRSSGIFGATGSGKSFLTRMLLAGLIQYNRAAVLVYDMHNEYGLDDTASDTGKNVRGLRSGFGASKVQIVGLGATATIRSCAPDFNLVLGYDDIIPQDVELLSRALNLKETTATVLDALSQRFGSHGWFGAFKRMRRGAVIEEDGKKVNAPDSVAFWANQDGVNVMAAEGLHDKLRLLFNRPYIIENPPADSIRAVIDALKAGKHIVLSFGDFESDLDYLLISNLLTRRIREEWERMTNAFRAQNAPEPRPLLIVLEEAHKLLNRDMAEQTTFSTIAREMRKYYVTLLVIDQRPSQIYDEVMSQLGTRICGWLGDEDDIHAALAGLAGRDALRGMLSRLQPKEEALLLGWGVPMPILVRSRRYDEQFWQVLKYGQKSPVDAQRVIKTLYPD